MAIERPAKSGYPFFYPDPFRPEESNRWLSVQPPSGRSIGPALIAWQSSILQSRGARFCILILPTRESNRRLSFHSPSDRSIGPTLVA